MRLTYIKAVITNPARPRKSARLKFLVDSGAFYSVVPKKVLRRLGILPRRTKSFIFADGTEIKRSIGQVLIRLNGEEAASPVIFGEEGDSVLLGTVSLEALGFMLHPLRRELLPLPMLLAPLRPPLRFGCLGQPILARPVPIANTAFWQERPRAARGRAERSTMTPCDCAVNRTV
jgi:aspartyl protease family protein